MEEKLRVGEKGARDNTGKRDLANNRPEFPTVRRTTLGMNSPLVVPSPFARAAAEEQQKGFTNGWDPLFIGYTAAVCFHTSEIKINSWTTQAKKMRGSMPPNFEVREVLRTLEQVGLENMLPVWDDGRIIVEDGHNALKDEMKFATRKYRAPYGLEQVEMRQEGKELDAAGPLYLALTEYRKTYPTTPSPLSVGTPGDKRSGPVEDRFKRILERRKAESEEESMDETLSEAGEEMEVGNTPEPKTSRGGLHRSRTAERPERRRLGTYCHTTSELVYQQEFRFATDERDFQHGNDTLEYGRERTEHLRRKQDHVPRDSG